MCREARENPANCHYKYILYGFARQAFIYSIERYGGAVQVRRVEMGWHLIRIVYICIQKRQLVMRVRLGIECASNKHNYIYICTFIWKHIALTSCCTNTVACIIHRQKSVFAWTWTYTHCIRMMRVLSRRGERCGGRGWINCKQPTYVFVRMGRDKHIKCRCVKQRVVLIRQCAI